MPRNYYREALQEAVDSHPIDNVVDQRVRHRKLRKRILAAADKVIAALGTRKHLYLQLEQLFGDRAIDREEAIFNVGYEHGLAQGRREAGPLCTPDAGHRALVERLEQLALASDLRPPGAVAALLETAWGLALKTERASANEREASATSSEPVQRRRKQGR